MRASVILPSSTKELPSDKEGYLNTTLLKEKQCLHSQVSQFHCRYLYKPHITAEPWTPQVSLTLPAPSPPRVVEEHLVPAHSAKSSSLHTTPSPALCQKTALPNAMFMSLRHCASSAHEQQQPGRTLSSECEQLYQ